MGLGEAIKRIYYISISLLSAFLGFGIWALSPMLIGHREPWDSDYPFYSGVSLLGGVVLGLITKPNLIPCYLGFWFGQIFALAMLPGPGKNWLMLGVVSTAIGSLFFLGGSAAGKGIRMTMGRLLCRSRHHRETHLSVDS